MRTVYVLGKDPDRRVVRIATARPRRTRRKWWLAYRKSYSIVTEAKLAEMAPKGGICFTRYSAEILGLMR